MENTASTALPAANNKTPLDEKADDLLAFLESKAFLILLTLAVALCTSTFAAAHGFGFNWQYGILFGVALFALTFHFARDIPPVAMMILRGYAIIGLVLVTAFVSVSAWLSSASEKADKELAAVEEQIETLTSQIGSLGISIRINEAQNHLTTAKDLGANQFELQQQLIAAQAEKQRLSSGTHSYEAGQMAIFGHIQAVSGWKQESVDLVFMWLIISVFVAMELSLGYDIHKKDKALGK